MVCLYQYEHQIGFGIKFSPLIELAGGVIVKVPSSPGRKRKDIEKQDERRKPPGQGRCGNDIRHDVDENTTDCPTYADRDIIQLEDEGMDVDEGKRVAPVVTAIPIYLLDQYYLTPEIFRDLVVNVFVDEMRKNTSKPVKPKSDVERLLQQQGLQSVAIEGDGKCQFRALAHKLFGDEAAWKVICELLYAYFEKFASVVCSPWIIFELVF
jgi:hypothetical protein